MKSCECDFLRLLVRFSAARWRVLPVAQRFGASISVAPLCALRFSAMCSPRPLWLHLQGFVSARCPRCSASRLVPTRSRRIRRSPRSACVRQRPAKPAAPAAPRSASRSAFRRFSPCAHPAPPRARPRSACAPALRSAPCSAPRAAAAPPRRPAAAPRIPRCVAAPRSLRPARHPALPPALSRATPTSALPSRAESAQINSNFPYLVKIFLDGLRFTSYLSQLHFFADSRILLKEERPRGPRKNR